MILKTSADRMTALVVGALVLAALALVFILPSDALLAGKDTDMASEFVSWRAFLADSLRHGHIPLWNPYTYGGQPFLGGFESAALYPPNLLFVVLPLTPALNFSMKGWLTSDILTFHPFPASSHHFSCVGSPSRITFKLPD